MDSTTKIAGVSSVSAPAPVAGGVASRPPATASSQIAKLETQLSDWVHCESGKTSEGKAKIAEIQDKLDAIKDQVKKAEDAKPSALRSVPGMRLDGMSRFLDEQA